jgi:hypothetical protein
VVLGKPGFDLGERGRRDRFWGLDREKVFSPEITLEMRLAMICAKEFPWIATPFFASHSIVSYARPLQRRLELLQY